MHILPLFCNSGYWGISQIHGTLIRRGTCGNSDKCDYCIVGSENLMAREYEIVKDEAVAAKAVLYKPMIAAVTGVICVILLIYAVYMLICHEIFAFGKGNQDMFSQKALYGDMDKFVRILKAEGISEVHYIGNLEKKLEFIPGFVTAPWMISGMGILYGKK